jgi:hypothetical protein
MYFAIIYRTDLARKNVDFLKNPSGFSVKNIFDKKMLIGTVKDQAGINDFVRRYQELNPKFPLVNAYLSDINGKKQISANVPKPIVQSAPTAPTVQKPVLVSETKTETITKSDNTLIYVGIIGIIAFIFLQNKGKRK